MAQPAVVVAFSSRCGTTEQIAHAAAVGVVNARALPRLRRLADNGRPAPPECTDTLRRMRKEYVSPTEADIARSPALILVPTAGMTPVSDAWQSFMTMLDQLARAGTLTGKVAAVIDAGDSQTVASFSSALAARGFAVITVGSGDDARAHGRAVGAAIMGTAEQRPR
jgi:flavodoxin